MAYDLERDAFLAPWIARRLQPRMKAIRLIFTICACIQYALYVFFSRSPPNGWLGRLSWSMFIGVEFIMIYNWWNIGKHVEERNIRRQQRMLQK